MRRFILLNVVGVLGMGIYGILTDEPYWHEVGHTDSLYDSMSSLGILVNGPSAVLAERLSWPASSLSYFDGPFGLFHLLWSLLLAGQWRLYFRIASWSGRSVGRTRALNVCALVLALVGAVLAREAWVYGHRPSECHVYEYYWFVRVLGLAASGSMIAAVRWILARSASSPQGASSS